jgi:hypothetical protein
MQVGFSRDKGMFINRFERRHSKTLGRYKILSLIDTIFNIMSLFSCDFHEME